MPDFIIEPPERHIYAELIDGVWNWVNGCDECCGREGTWMTYIKCEKHDVCCSCQMPRSKLTDIPWGHPKGFQCKPCRENQRAIEKAKAIAKNAAKRYREWDYEDLSYPTCPYCDLEFEEPGHGLWEAEDEIVNCERCDHKFEVTANPVVTFTSRRLDTDEVPTPSKGG